MKIQNLLLVLIATVLTTGCTTFKPAMPTLPSIFKGDAPEANSVAEQKEEVSFGQPEKMLVVWKDSVRTEPGKPAMRGFGGRIFLYNQAGQPIRAKGELVVYGFDDSVKDRQGSKADQKIVFKNESLQQRYSKSGLGDSYSIWVDWDEAGGPDKSVTLIPFFRTVDGEIVKAGQSIYTLHSPSKDGELYKEKLVSHQSDAAEGNKVAHANFLETPGEGSQIRTVGGVEAVSSTGSESRNSVRTTTIQVPASTQRRLRESSLNASQTENNSTETVPATNAKEAKFRAYPSRIEAARKKRLEEIGKGTVFGVPGQL
jgi:hypothetical protein